jgi:hypothetical protein
MAVTREQLVNTFPRQSKRATTAMNQHTTKEELLQKVSTMWSVPRLKNENLRASSVRAGKS